MLVEVFHVPVADRADTAEHIYPLPPMSAEEAEHYCYITSNVLSDIRFGLTNMRGSSGAAGSLFSLAHPIPDTPDFYDSQLYHLRGMPTKAISYQTFVYNGLSNVQPVAAVMVWKVERAFYAEKVRTV